MILPNFFIVGAAKSGTTSLVDYLKQHPEIYIPYMKEPFYFVSYVGKFRFTKNYNEYLSLFNNAGDAKAVGEASTGYLFDEHAAYAIHQQFPNAKIIIILRNPVDMAFSYWRYMQITGNESNTFEQAISNAEREYRKTEQFKRTALAWWASYLYLERAAYYLQVKRYIDLFGQNKVKVYIFEDFFKNIEESCKDVFSFLGVDTNFTPIFSIKNEGGELRSKILKKIHTRQYPFIKHLLTPNTRARIKSWIESINTKKGKKVVMNPDTRKRLEEFFKEDIQKLENLLGRKIPVWR